jgi:hypothetical protein
MLAFHNETPKMEATLIYIETPETGGVIFSMYIHSAVLVPRRKHDIAGAASCRVRQVLLYVMT